jgi:hypothetical protein
MNVQNLIHASILVIVQILQEAIIVLVPTIGTENTAIRMLMNVIVLHVCITVLVLTTMVVTIAHVHITGKVKIVKMM